MSKTVYGAVTIMIDLVTEQIKVETTKRGVRSIKNVALVDVLNCFCSSAQSSDMIRSDFLPENCIALDICDQLKHVAIWHPARRCEFTFFKTLYENFPLPRMVFSFDITPLGKVTGYRMAVVADEKLKPTTKLYEYPFSNVYSSTDICVGAANSLPTYKSLCSLASLPNYILSLPNSDHNFNRAHNKLRLDYRELLDHLADKSPDYYYERVLIPRRDGKVLQDFIDRTIR